MTAAFWLWSSPLWGAGYQFWSGVGSDIGEVTIIGGLVMIWRQHECHVAGCHRPGFHPSDEHDGHVVCRKHHPHLSDPKHPINGGNK